MNENTTFERDLEQWLQADAPSSGPTGLHEAIIERARSMSQRPRVIAMLGSNHALDSGWSIGRPSSRTPFVLVSLALLVALVVAGAIAVGAFRSTPPRVLLGTGNMVGARAGHGATLLPDGRVLVDGGNDGTASPATAELFDPVSGRWVSTEPMAVALASDQIAPSGVVVKPATATLLPSGKVLVTGGTLDGSLYDQRTPDVQLFDPASRTWIATGSLLIPRKDHTATLLGNGTVLVAGGAGGEIVGLPAAAELYDPASGTWTATGRLVLPRGMNTATLLEDGRVLVAGGQEAGPVAAAEVYDPVRRSWAPTRSMTIPRAGATATRLPGGAVLVAGGVDHDGRALASVELYDPAAGRWIATGSMGLARAGHTATPLADGRVLIAGGESGQDPFFGFVASAEIYDPQTGSFSATGPMTGARVFHAATRLADGRVLVTGGYSDLAAALASAEIYDPGTGTFSAAGPGG